MLPRLVLRLIHNRPAGSPHSDDVVIGHHVGKEGEDCSSCKRR
jgi:hypothetical protein